MPDYIPARGPKIVFSRDEILDILINKFQDMPQSEIYGIDDIDIDEGTFTFFLTEK